MGKRRPPGRLGLLCPHTFNIFILTLSSFFFQKDVDQPVLGTGSTLWFLSFFFLFGFEVNGFLFFFFACVHSGGQYVTQNLVCVLCVYGEMKPSGSRCTAVYQPLEGAILTWAAQCSDSMMIHTGVCVCVRALMCVYVRAHVCVCDSVCVS